MRRIAPVLASIGALWSAGSALAQSTGAVSFASEVLPILKDHCHSCHGAAQQMSGLDLRTRVGALRGGSKGPALTPRDPAASHLYRRVAGIDQPAMPLGRKLDDASIATLRRWIEQGAPWDAAAEQAAAGPEPKIITGEDRRWWAFQKPLRRDPPTITDPRFSRHPVDAFLATKLSEKRLSPAPPADPRTLARRAFLDLTGLLPAPADVDAFATDRSPQAWERLIDRLLASPHYGERWGRHWLDVARYAYSGGYEQDFDYPNAWRYRDYVIRAFNADKPYDQFIREQLAGDELDADGHDPLIATGFLRVGPTVGFREKDNPRYRYTYLDDMIGTAGRAFLGLTVNCARCHDHKFDPITQLDYYRVQAAFFPYISYEHPLAPRDQVEAWQRERSRIDAAVKPLKERIALIEAPYRRQAFEKKLETFPADIQLAVRTPEEQRTEGQKLLATQVLSIRGGNYRSLMNPDDRAEVDKLSRRVQEIERTAPAPLESAMGVRDGDFRFAPNGPGDEELPGKGNREAVDGEGFYVPAPGQPYRPPVAHFLERGDPDSKKQPVEPGFLEVIGDLGKPVAMPPSDERLTTGRRRAFADWIATKENPLTARVMVNRIWQHHFGRGLVSTASNFGRLGQPPSHPELLDWLATEFAGGGWSVKRMHRLIMTSEAYRMASAYHVESNARTDPDNTLLWRFPERRLESEAIRDIILDAAGNLNREAGGRPFFPPVPDRVLQSVAKGIWKVNEDGPAVWRRSVYSYFKRGMRYPMFEVFDQPDPNVTCEGRNTTTVPTQALTLLNNDFVLRQARAFAARVEQQGGAAPEARVRTAYRIALGREPTAREMALNLDFLTRRSLADLSNVILNLNEFVYIQ